MRKSRDYDHEKWTMVDYMYGKPVWVWRHVLKRRAISPEPRRILKENRDSIRKLTEGRICIPMETKNGGE